MNRTGVCWWERRAETGINTKGRSRGSENKERLLPVVLLIGKPPQASQAHHNDTQQTHTHTLSGD